MPVLRIDMFAGRSVDQKRQLVAEITEVLVRIVECDPASVRIAISEFAPENYGIAGSLQIDAAPTG